MQVRKWLISGEINYNVCRICSLTLLPPEVLIPTPITLSVIEEFVELTARGRLRSLAFCCEFVGTFAIS